MVFEVAFALFALSCIAGTYERGFLMKLRRMISLILAFVLLGCPTITAFAEAMSNPHEIQPLYDLTFTVSAVFSISGGVATCKGRITPSYNNCTCNMAVRLQRKSGDKWVNVNTWTGTGSGTHGCTISKTHTLTTHGTYRVHVSGTVVADDGAREYVSKATPEKIY